MLRSLLAVVGASAAVLVGVGCAVGGGETGELPAGGGGPGAGGFGGATQVATTSASVGGAGGGTPSGAGGGGGELGNCTFDAPNTCDTAELIPAIAGDENDPPAVRYGVTSKWYRIRITEENGSILEEDLSYTVTLSSAPGMAYDLVVYQGPQAGNPSCGAPPKVGVVQPNGDQTVHDGWDDDQGIGGEDDSVWLIVEVRYVSGDACDAAAQWTLTIQGHT